MKFVGTNHTDWLRYAVVRKYLITKAVKYGHFWCYELKLVILKLNSSLLSYGVRWDSLDHSLCAKIALYWDFYVVEVYFKIEIINLIYIYKLPKTLFR